MPKTIVEAMYPNAVLADVPLAYYRMDDTSTTMIDWSSNHLNGSYGSSVVLGRAGLVATNSDAAAGFPGVSYSALGIATVPQSSTLQPQSAVTIEAFVNETSAPGSIVEIMTYGPSGGQPWSLRVSASNQLTSRIYTTSGVFDAIGPTISTGQTYHVAMTYDGSAEKLYVNGSLAASTPVTGVINYSGIGTSGLGIGGSQNSTRTAALSATIDDVAVYGTALSATRIAAHYSASTSTPAATTDPYAYAVTADSPTAYYRLDDPGTALVDATMNHLNGSYGSSVVRGATGLLSTNSDAAAQFPGGSYNMAGIATVGQSATFQQQPYVTVEALVNETAVPGGTTPLEIVTYGPNGGQAWSLRVNAPSNQLTARVHTTAGVFDVAGQTIVPGTTYHVAMTYDGSAERLYVNGALQNSVAANGTVDFSGVGTTGLGIGGAINSTRTNAFSGTIDEVAIYGSALAATRIATHYAASRVPGTIVWQTGGGTSLGQWRNATDGQCSSPSVSGTSAAMTLLRNSNGANGTSTCYRNMLDPLDSATGENFLLAMGSHYTFLFQTVVTLNTNYKYYSGNAADIPGLVWQTHDYGGTGGDFDDLVIQNTYVVCVNGVVKAYCDPPPQNGGLPIWNFHTADETDFTGNAYNSPDTLQDGEIDTWQIDVTAENLGQSGGSVVVRRNGFVVYNAPSHVCHDPDCFFDFGAYMPHWSTSAEPSDWNSNGVTIQVNGMTVVKQ